MPKAALRKSKPLRRDITHAVAGQQDAARMPSVASEVIALRALRKNAAVKGKSTDKTTGKSAGKSAGKATDKSTGKPIVKTMAKPPKAKRTREPTTEGATRVPVNEIVQQWQRERPDLDPAPMRLFGVLAQAHLLTTPYINRVIAQHGLVRGTFDVLSALRRAGPPFSLTPKQLAESLMLSGAGMTSRLDRLELLHLIARLPEPNDRRSLKIQLTQKGVKLIDEVIPQIVAAQWRLVSSLGNRDTATLIDLLHRLTETLFASIDSTESV